MTSFSRVILSEVQSSKSKNLAVMLIVAAMFVACSDDSGTSSSNVIPNEISYGTLTDSRDGKTYKTVTIGTQTWMAENLNYDYNEGSAKSYCYNNSADSCAKYGRLYMWSAAMDSAAVFSTAGKGCGYGVECKVTELAEVRGVCPEGWHLPSKDEWNTLFTAVGGTGSAGRSLKSTSGWNNSGNGVDSFGFSVLPAGRYYVDFNNVGYSAYFWSSTELNSDDAFSMYFSYDYELAYVDYDSKGDGFSVRCLRD